MTEARYLARQRLDTLHNRSLIPCTTEARYLAQQKLDTLHNRSLIPCMAEARYLAQQKLDTLHDRGSIPCTTEARYLAQQRLDTLHNRSHINLQNLMKLIVYSKNHLHCYTFWLFSQVLLAFIISLNLFVVHELGPFVMRSTCRYCHGTRMYIKFPCTECEGKGSTVQRKKVTVPVPAGKKFVMHDVDCSV